MWRDVGEGGALPGDGLFGGVGPEEGGLALEGSEELVELFAGELDEGAHFSASPLEEVEGSDAAGIVELTEGVHGELFGLDDGTVILFNLDFGRDGVTRSTAVEVRW